MISAKKNKLESVFSDFSKLKRTSLKKLANFFQLAVHCHPCHPQPKIINTSFCALVGQLITKLNHYFDVSIATKCVFRCSKLR